MVEGIDWSDLEDPVSAGDVLTGDDPEPPPGTVVELGDGRRWKRIIKPRITYRRWRWVEVIGGFEYPFTRWQWALVTADGPVTVVQVPELGR